MKGYPYPISRSSAAAANPLSDRIQAVTGSEFNHTARQQALPGGFFDAPPEGAVDHDVNRRTVRQSECGAAVQRGRAARLPSAEDLEFA